MTGVSRSRAVVQVGPAKFEVHTFPLPKIGENDALLRLEACGICGSDIEQYDGHFDEMGWTKGPTIPGHEPLGIIDQIGENAARRWGVQKGDRVAVEALVPCLACDACDSGRRFQCTGWGRINSYGLLGLDVEPSLLGGYSEYMYLHPNSVVHKVSKALSPQVAVLFNPLAAGVRWAYMDADLKMGDTVVILGAGQRGLACVIAAAAAGAGKIIVTDLARSSNKLDLALELGAHHAIVADEENVADRVKELSAGRGADVVVDVVPVSTQTVLDAIEMVRVGGRIVLCGVKSGNPTTLYTDILMKKSITLRGVFGVDTNAYRQAIRLLEAGGRPYDRIATASYGLSQAEEAILHLAGRDGRRPGISVTIDPTAA